MRVVALSVLLLVFVGCENSNGGTSAAIEESQGSNDVGAAPADQVASDAAVTYYTGVQTVNLTQPIPCYVELRFSEDQTQAEMRAILTQTHKVQADPDTATIGIDVTLQQKFLGGSIKANGYAFEDATPSAPVKQAILFGDASNPIKEMRAAIFHDGHHDPVACAQLQVTAEDQLASVKAIYENFEEFEENLTGAHHDHDEDHDHDHD